MCNVQTGGESIEGNMPGVENCGRGYVRWKTRLEGICPVVKNDGTPELILDIWIIIFYQSSNLPVCVH